MAASDGCTPSQNTNSVALLQVPGDFELHKNKVLSTVPVLQQPLVASLKPTKRMQLKKKIIMGVVAYLGLPCRSLWFNTIIRWRFNNVVEGLENVEDS